MNEHNHQYKIQTNKFCWYCISTLFVVILILLNLEGQYNQCLAICVLFYSALSVIKSRKNWYLLIIEITLLFCNYSIVGPNYLFHINSSFFEFSNDPVGALGLNILLGFTVMNYIFAPSVADKNQEKPITSEGRYNPIIIIGFLALLSLIWFFGFTRPTAVGGRGTPTAIYEYSIVFIIIGFYYTGNKIWAKICITFAAIMFAMQNFIYGGRITGVQLILCIVMCLFIDKISVRKVVIAATVGLPVMTGIGSDRGSFALTLASFTNSVQNIFGGKLTLDTAYSAYYTSLTFLKAKEYTEFGRRMYMFKQFLLSLILGGSVIDSNLPDYTRTTFMHYWGGVTPYYAYFYLGIVGVFLISLYIGFLKKQIRDKDTKSDFIRCMSIYVVATTFRWYLYAPTQILRGILLLWFVFTVARLFHSISGQKAI